MTTGDILIADLNPIVGSEQGGMRPVVVVSAPQYAVIPGLFLAVPLTSSNRELRHHIEVPANQQTGLERISYAMTEQLRSLSYRRIKHQLGRIDGSTLHTISRYLHLFIS